MKKPLIIIIIVLVVAAIVYFSVFYPEPFKQELAGTIGGVEKAEKFRGEQLKDEEILIENEDFVKFSQSAEWQNLLKNEEFLKIALSQDFQKIVILNVDIQKALICSQDFQRFFEGIQIKFFNTYQKSLQFLLRD